MSSYDIVFPKLGIEIKSMNPVAFNLFGIKVFWYGIIIVSGVLAGLFLARYRAKRNDEDPDIYSDFLIYALIGAILGARLYYVIFSWDSYKNDLISIFAFREGGLAIYGGVIGAFIALAIYTKVKKLSFLKMADTAVPGLALGQVIGRMGNFVNMEAFGGHTDGIFGMALNAEKAKIPVTMRQFIAPLEGYVGEYLMVQPTFAYEALWNVGVIVILMAYTKHKKFEGELVVLYLILYGIGRGWIEGLRTDQLLIGNTGIAVSQLLAIILAIFGVAILAYKHITLRKKDI